MDRMPNNLNHVLTKFTRIPMRHTFTMEQKSILLKCFEEGMVGQSMAYHEKIAQCAQKTGLDFDTVKNWVGNQRRKRRMEEVQSMTIYAAGQEQLLDPSSPQILTKYPRIPGGHLGPQKPIQVLYFPRSSDGPVNLQGGPVDTSVSHLGESSPYSGQGPGLHSKATRPHRGGATSIPLHPGPADSGHHHMDNSHIRLSSPSVTPNPNHRLPSPVRIFAPRHSPVAPRGFADDRVQSGMQCPRADGMDIGPPVSRNGLQNRVGPRHDNPRGDRTNQGPGGTSGRDGQVSPNGQHYFSDGSPLSNNINPEEMAGPSSDGFDGETSGTPSRMDHGESEWKELQIQKVVETIQMYIDQLNQLGCEAFLASVSRETLSTFLCGTTLGNSYFTAVNEDQPFSEFIERGMDGMADSKAEPGLDVTADLEGNPELVDSEVGPDVNQEEMDPETGSELRHDSDVPDGQKMEGEAEEEMAKEGTEDDRARPSVCADVDRGALQGRNDGVIRSGEEVYIVNKEHYIIGRGTLQPAPHQKVTPKAYLKGDNAGTVNDAGADGFIEEVGEEQHS